MDISWSQLTHIYIFQYNSHLILIETNLNKNRKFVFARECSITLVVEMLCRTASSAVHVTQNQGARRQCLQNHIWGRHANNEQHEISIHYSKIYSKIS